MRVLCMLLLLCESAVASGLRTVPSLPGESGIYVAWNRYLGRSIAGMDHETYRIRGDVRVSGGVIFFVQRTPEKRPVLLPEVAVEYGEMLFGYTGRNVPFLESVVDTTLSGGFFFGVSNHRFAYKLVYFLGVQSSLVHGSYHLFAAADIHPARNVTVFCDLLSVRRRRVVVSPGFVVKMRATECWVVARNVSYRWSSSTLLFGVRWVP